MPRKVLVVDDNTITLSLNKSLFMKEGYDVLYAHDGETALKLAEQQPDCIVLDVLLPDYNGFDLAPLLRKICDAPIVFLTSCKEDDDIVRGLSTGDDFMSKPYSFVELTTRVKNHIRRKEHKGRIMDFGELVIHTDGRSAAVNGKPLSLTSREFDILLTLAERENTPVATAELYKLVWNDETTFTPHVVMVNISTLKKKLERVLPGQNYIKSERGKGYTFLNPPQSANGAVTEELEDE